MRTLPLAGGSGFLFFVFFCFSRENHSKNKPPPVLHLFVFVWGHSRAGDISFPPPPLTKPCFCKPRDTDTPLLSIYSHTARFAGRLHAQKPFDGLREAEGALKTALREAKDPPKPPAPQGPSSAPPHTQGPVPMATAQAGRWRPAGSGARTHGAEVEP